MDNRVERGSVIVDPFRAGFQITESIFRVMVVGDEQMVILEELSFESKLNHATLQDACSAEGPDWRSMLQQHDPLVLRTHHRG